MSKETISIRCPRCGVSNEADSENDTLMCRCCESIIIIEQRDDGSVEVSLA